MTRSTAIGTLSGAVLALGLFGLGAVFQQPNPVAAPGRFQAILLHPSIGTEWSGILDTQTGCVWVYTSEQALTHPPSTPEEVLQAAIGSEYLASVRYDPQDFVTMTVGADRKPNLAPVIAAAFRESAACSAARRAALGIESTAH